MNNSNPPQPTERLPSIDILRGIIMVIMTLDHVRDYFSNLNFSPTDLSKTSVVLFFTRWITHYCAPTFIFLAGISAFLLGQKVDTKKQLAVFLFTRGLWLIILELTVMRFAWFFNVDYDFTIAQVIWAIGWVMFLLAPFVFLPSLIVGILGLGIIVSHNAFDFLTPKDFGVLDWLWIILHDPEPLTFGKKTLFISYPILPWFGVMAAGFGFGEIFLNQEPKRRTVLIATGIGLTLLFVILRFANVYGDAKLWGIQQDYVFTFLSFLNCTKYPPSLLYLLMTLGPAIFALAFLEKWKGAVAQFFLTIGMVPMFYYILHVFLIHTLALLSVWIRGGKTDNLFSAQFFWEGMGNDGYGLPVWYIIWMVVVAMLYPVVKWYANYKRNHKDLWWISYL